MGEYIVSINPAPRDSPQLLFRDALHLFSPVPFSACCLLPAAWGAGDIAPDLKSGAFWNLPQPDLFGKYFNGESGGWVDKGKTQLRIAKPAIKLGKMSLGEMLVHWKEGVPQSMTIMMYNKGDNGAIDKEEFEKRLDHIREALTGLTGVQPKEYRASAGRRW